MDSVQLGSGSRFTAFPAENATGNWVKVVQRLPVRIGIDHFDPNVPLHAGLSATVEVDTGRDRPLLVRVERFFASLVGSTTHAAER